MFKLAFRNIFRNGLRTLLTLAAIIIGVVAIVVSGGFVEDTFEQLRETTIHSRIGHAQIFRKGFLEYGRQNPARYSINESASIVAVVKALPGVWDVMSRLSFSGLANNGRADLPILGEGIEPEKEGRLGTATTIIEGRALRDSDTFGAMIGEGVASSLHVRVGDYVTLIANTSEGALNTFEYQVVGVFRTFSKEYDNRAVRIPLSSAQELLTNKAVQSIIVLLNDTAKTEAISARLREKSELRGFDVKPWYELADFYQKTEDLYRRQFGALQSIILIMLVLSVSSTINMVIYERTGEFGTLQALGLRSVQIFKLVLLENALLGAIGGVLGMGIGVLLAWLISSIGIPMPPPPGSNVGYIASIKVVPNIIWAAGFVGFLAAILAAVMPARRASRLVVVEALRHNI